MAGGLTVKRRIGTALFAIAATLGLSLATSVPAEAVTMSRVQHCIWPKKASVQTVNHSGSWKAVAYSDTGWKLGTKYGTGTMYWHTNWEDITVFVYSSDPSYYVSGHCRY